MLHGTSDSRELIRDLFVVSLNVFGRSLVEFFDDPKPNAHPDDVHAVDYIPTWTGEGDGADSLHPLKQLFVPGVNKQLADITARRCPVGPSE